MTHQFPEIYTSLSELLSHILDNVGYSQDDRNRKVHFANVSEVFNNIASVNKEHRHHMFGSRSEGSTGPGLKSDCDMLFYSLNFKVVTNLSQCQPELTNFLMVKDNHTHPGYVKLQLIDTSSNYIAIPLYGVVGENDTTTDSFNRRVLRNTIFQFVDPDNISGPANHLNNHLKELSKDIVIALRSSQWPNEAQHFLLRHRRNGWPTTMQMENARKYGCFVTPIAHPYSEELNTEWRLSFSIAEREMIRSFNDATMKVYLLLKMVKKTYIEPFIGDAFSSYHCKVCMMWMRELLPSEIWRTENILQCLVLCIRQIYEWATMGFCPDFFIVENNLYDRKITGEVRNNLVKILWCLLSTNGTFLLGIQCCNLGQYISIQMSAYDYNCFPILRSFEVEDSITLEEFVNCWLVIDSAQDCCQDILRTMPQTYTTLVYYLNTLIRASQHLSYSMLCPLQHVQKFVLSQLGFHLVALCKENANLMSLEELDRDVALASRCLSFGINMDNSSVRLKLCGLGIDLGNPNLLEVSLQHINANLMRCVFFGSMVGCHASNSWRNTLHRNRYNIVEILQTLHSYYVFYLPTEMSICQKPLRMEMFRSVGTLLELRDEIRDFWFDMAVINPFMCLYFFQYLNFSRQGKVRQKQITIEKMAQFVSSNPNIQHKDTAFNVLGYSLMLENMLPISFVCFVKSLIIRPYHNAAKFYLGILFNKINAINRCNTQYGSR